MRVGSVLAPGKPGTKRLTERYGEALVCVRYRYDVRSGRRYKTVELIVDEASWEPKPSKTVFVRVRYHERALRERIKASGGWWHSDRRLWSLPYGRARALGLSGRIVE